MATPVWFEESFATAYEAWYDTAGRQADILEKALLGRLLERCRGARTVL